MPQLPHPRFPTGYILVHRMIQAIASVFLVVLVAGCEASSERRSTLFVQRSPDETGVTFVNRLAESPDLNILNYLYYYNGGGVAAGDVNGDSLLDLYFTANEAPNRLYLNQGGFRFDDVTAEAGVAGTADWTTGLTMADVNADGRLDLYVAAVSGYLGLEGRNELYINRGAGAGGVPRFDEQAAAYGLDHAGYGTHAAFFDYDLDGDLDAYLLNHSTHDERTYQRASVREERHPRAGDKLLRNTDGHFVDVSEEAGIYGGRVGYGLGVSVSDFDRDGCPDLYVANDFHENDYLYFNNCDGTFSETIAASTGHTSLSSMGTDAADFNNDGRSDIAVLDMMPAQERIRKTTAGNDAPEVYRTKRRYGYHHQLARNTLQLNHGQRRFSAIGAMAGVHATDWSWAPLFADLDNDGWKDLYVTNGIYRRPNNLDYVDYVTNEFLPARQRDLQGDDTELLQRMPHEPVPNHAFRNRRDLTFADRSATWGLDTPSFSNGAVYADLDNDGDLDLVTNNVNSPASIYENRADTLTIHHYLTVRLAGADENTQGIGVRVELVQSGRRQVLEQQPVRGFQSSVDPRLHFGLGREASVDSLTVIWPGGSVETRTGVMGDRIITLREEEATGSYRYPSPTQVNPRFTDVTDAQTIDYQHAENDFDDFYREPLMPHRLSTEGPALAVGDVNGDGLDDLFAGGAKRQPAMLLVQRSTGGFQATNASPWRADQLHEDVDAAFFDAEGDGDLDLYVVSGGNEFAGTADALRDRLYLNDGAGRFRRAEGALPDDMTANGGTVAPGDFDADGDTDLFVGSRVVALRYGATPSSYLLENDGTGRFRDVTADRAPGLVEAGMVADAAWADATGDGRLDLVVVGEWMPIRVFAQEDGRFAERTEAAGFGSTSGWWNVVRAVDFDGDGDDDLVAGNLGLNAVLKATPEEPVRLYVHDFNQDGRLDPILTYYNHGTSYPFYGRDRFAQQIPSIERRFPRYEDFGALQVEDLFSAEQIEAATVREVQQFAHVYAENRGDATFSVRPLPSRAQIAPVYSILADDIDRDGHLDLVLGGNFYGVHADQGRYDASYGLWLRGTEAGFEAVPPAESGLYLRGEVRALRVLRTHDGDRLIVAARNDDRLQIVRASPPAHRLSRR